MKLAILGYGKMGKEVERIAIAKKVEIASLIDLHPLNRADAHKQINAESLKNADVVIDFTSPASVVENIRKVAEQKKNMVVATTGWGDKLNEVKGIVEKSGIGLIHSSNFSIGVNIYYKIIEDAAKLMDKAENYDVFGYELHHNQKLDSPSGTAKAIAEILLKNIHRKKKAEYGMMERKINPEELHFASIRSGSIPGTHVVGFDSEADTIEIRHTARNRSGFATGAIMAADWIRGKKGLFTMNDFMKDYFK